MVGMKDKVIRFEEEKHQYFVGDTELYSVTNFISKFFPKFDNQGHSERLAVSRNTTPEKLRQQWEQKGIEAGQFGRDVHEFAQMYASNEPFNPPKTPRMEKYFRQIIRVFTEQNLTISFSERVIGSTDLLLGGTIDLGIQKDGNLILCDWKTNASIDRENMYDGRKALFPISHLDDCNFNQYSLQLSMYAYILEREYNEKVDGLVIYHIKENGYEVIPVRYLKEEVINLLKKIGKLN